MLPKLLKGLLQKVLMPPSTDGHEAPRPDDSHPADGAPCLDQMEQTEPRPEDYGDSPQQQQPMPKASPCENQELRRENHELRLAIQTLQRTSEREYSNLCNQANHIIRGLDHELRGHKIEIQKLSQQNHSLRQQIEMLERENAQQTLASTGSYMDSSATPPLLVTATDDVKSAIERCAAAFLSDIKRAAGSLGTVNPDYCPHVQPAHAKVVLQSILSSVFFHAFENDAFGILDASSFLNPKDKKKICFSLYRKLRDEEAPEILENDDGFRKFIEAKYSEVGPAVKKGFMNSLRLEEIIEGSGKSFNSFVRLGKAVYVLHKLALAFEPTAEIVRVPNGAPFLDDYMRNVIVAEDGEVEFLPEVAFPVMPGFIVRNTVVKAYVYLRCAEIMLE